MNPCRHLNNVIPFTYYNQDMKLSVSQYRPHHRHHQFPNNNDVFLKKFIFSSGHMCIKCHSHSDRQRDHPPNIAGCCVKWFE